MAVVESSLLSSPSSGYSCGDACPLLPSSSSASAAATVLPIMTAAATAPYSGGESGNAEDCGRPEIDQQLVKMVSDSRDSMADVYVDKDSYQDRLDINNRAALTHSFSRAQAKVIVDSDDENDYFTGRPALVAEEKKRSAGGGRHVKLASSIVLLPSSSSSVDDSGCESDHASGSGGDCGSGSGVGGGVVGGVDSVYSTVTSCGSDLALYHLRTDAVATIGEGGDECDGGDDGGGDGEHGEACTASTCLLVNVAVHNVPDCDPDEQQPGGPATNEDFRLRSWSLDPQLHLRPSIVADDASIGTPEDLLNGAAPVPVANSTVFPPLSSTVNGLRHSRSEPSLSASASLSSMPICRICHQPAAIETGDMRSAANGGNGMGIGDLISPCRCAGTMRYIHAACLMRWIEVSNRRYKRPAVCELCQFQYQRHKRFRRVAGHWVLPRTSTRDKWLHALFVLMLLIMLVSGVVTVFCFKQQDSGKRRTSLDTTELTVNEVVTLVCGVLFFGAFFVAMYAEVKARHSLYELVSRFVRMNQQWYIDQYDRDKDDKFRTATEGSAASSSGNTRCAQHV